LPSPEEVSLRSLAFPAGADTGYAAGDLNSIFMTTDAGQSWLQVFGMPEGAGLNALCFPSGTQTGFAVGNRGLLLRGDNGGISWMILSRGFAGPILDMTFPSDSLVGYVVTASALMKTFDGGSNWLQQPLPVPVAALTFPLDNLSGYAVGAAGTILKTLDGAQSWTQQSCPGITDDYVAVCSPRNPNSVYACALNGSVAGSMDGGMSWTQLATPDSQCIPYSIFFLTPQLGFVGGSSSSIFRTTDGGATWQGVTTAGRGYRSFSFPASGDTGYACGYDGALVKTADAGLSWFALPTVTNASLTRVLFPIDAQVGYAAGDQGTVLKTTDGGSNWFFLTAPLARANLVGLSFPTDNLTGFLAGDAGAVLVTHSGGVSDVSRRPVEPDRTPCNLSVFPNPARHWATLRYSLTGPGRVRLRLFNRLGRLEGSVLPAQDCAETSGECRLDVSRLAAGVYFLEAAGSKATSVVRFVVAR
jgi:photosystem II stability/assembly factor-like uncharacterized protein